jgi:hypothetical protein
MDDDGDGVADVDDSCSTGTLSWTSNETSDYGGDGCKDRSVLIDFYDTEDWTYQEFIFSIRNQNHHGETKWRNYLLGELFYRRRKRLAIPLT